MFIRIFVGLVCLLLSANAFAEVKEMSGMTLEQFGDFAKNWHFVTVRYRLDSGEMRFVYANDLAWQALSKNETDFPKGAVFAKIGVLTKPDPSFISSVVPSGARRVQFMTRDQLKFVETDGWGYAVFDSSGNTYPGHLRQQTLACAACHKIVPERGYVFSQKMDFTDMKPFQDVNWRKYLTFESREAKQLPGEVQKYTGKKGQVEFLIGNIQKFSFSGTMDEIRPLLALQAASKLKPAVLISEDKQNFSVAVPQMKSKACAKGEVQIQTFHTVPNENQPILKGEVCQKI